MIYLDNAATSLPKPKGVARAMTLAIERFGNPGRSGHQASLDAGRAVYECRAELARLFNVQDPFRFVFCSSCTDALNQAIKGMLPDGGHVITYSDDKVHGCPFYSFGAGSRRCLGMLVAQTQISVLVSEFLRRITRFTLAPPGHVEMNVGDDSTRLGPIAMPLQWST